MRLLGALPPARWPCSPVAPGMPAPSKPQSQHFNGVISPSLAATTLKTTSTCLGNMIKVGHRGQNPQQRSCPALSERVLRSDELPGICQRGWLHPTQPELPWTHRSERKSPHILPISASVTSSIGYAPKGAGQYANPWASYFKPFGTYDDPQALADKVQADLQSGLDANK